MDPGLARRELSAEDVPVEMKVVGGLSTGILPFGRPRMAVLRCLT
jgi:hypothetical protein